MTFDTRGREDVDRRWRRGGARGRVVEVAGEASTEATGELVTRSHFDTALAQIESRLTWRLVTAGTAIAAVVVAALRFLG